MSLQRSILGKARLPAIRSYSTTPTETFVKRTTLFKISKEEDVVAVLRQYEILKKTALKDGKPYIISNAARRVLNTDSPRSEGFTVASQSIFRNHEDHEFYDKDCSAHKALREVTGRVKTGVMTIVTEGEWPEPKN